MFYSKKHNVLYIASPKSGSTSVEKYMMTIDENGETHSMTINGKKYKGDDMYFGIMGHARAWEIREAIGGDEYEKLQVFGFVRHPFDKLISSYHFNKSISSVDAFNIKGNRKVLKRQINGFISRLSTRILPLSIWVLIFPMKTSYEYFYDREGNRIVKYLGRTDSLNDDLKIILNDIGIDVSDKIPHVNRSEHKDWSYYLKFRPIRNFLEKKYKKDIELYEMVKKEMTLLTDKWD